MQDNSVINRLKLIGDSTFDSLASRLEMLQGTPVGNKRLTKTTSMMEDLHTSFITSYGQRVQAYIQKVNQKEQQENYTDDLEKQLEGI